ncbi:hypothetical protein Tco_0859703 [Tanacetum coccineum]|uniref:Uncharacterized protein n=1 Tax=Tanacetum coccineum TaxID=301880 RepID=A0ABQ5BGD5_9ASTR
MSADFAVTYTFVHSKARSWRILFEDPYEEAAQQLLEQAPRSLEYVPDPMELEDPSMAQIRAATPSTYHLLLPSGSTNVEESSAARCQRDARNPLLPEGCPIIFVNTIDQWSNILRREDDGRRRVCQLVVMSADFAVTYTFVHSKARSWRILFEDPYEEAAQQLLEQAPRSLEYVPDPMELEDHVTVYIPEPEHPEDLVLSEDEAPIEAYITEVASAPTPPLPPPSFLP